MSVAFDYAAHDLPELSLGEFRMLRDFVYDRSGLFFADSKKFLLEARLYRRLQALGIGNFDEYVAHLRSAAHGPRELLELLDVVTTHETSFFRTPGQIDVFRHEVLPALMSRRRRSGKAGVRVWSAACSSGEEPYTLAIAFLEQFGDDCAAERFNVVGTDVARSVLEKAREAIYGHHSLRNTPAYYIQKYFDAIGPDAYRLREEPKKLVEFRLLNFADEPGMRAMTGFQTVFCRNALIYFDTDARRRFVSHFADSLDPEGYLFLGHAETLHGLSDKFRLVQFSGGGMVYQKPPGSALERSEACNRIA